MRARVQSRRSALAWRISAESVVLPGQHPMPLPLATLRQTAVFMGGSRPPDVGLGLLTRWCPASLIDAAIETCDTGEQRIRKLPARSVVYCELARCLFPGEGYEQVLDHLLFTDDDISAGSTDQIPCGSSLCRARVKLGARTMEAVFHRVAGPIAEPHSCPAGFWRQLRLEAFDGTTFEVADTAENDAAFERPAGSCGPGGYPQVRMVALVECATHAVLDAVIGGRGQGETTLALDLAGAAGPDTLVLADRNMLGVQLWTAFRDRGAELLWRVKKTVATRPQACWPTAAGWPGGGWASTPPRRCAAPASACPARSPFGSSSTSCPAARRSTGSPPRCWTRRRRPRRSWPRCITSAGNRRVCSAGNRRVCSPR